MKRNGEENALGDVLTILGFLRVNNRLGEEFNYDTLTEKGPILTWLDDKIRELSRSPNDAIFYEIAGDADFARDEERILMYHGVTQSGVKLNFMMNIDSFSIGNATRLDAVGAQVRHLLSPLRAGVVGSRRNAYFFTIGRQSREGTYQKVVSQPQDPSRMLYIMAVTDYEEVVAPAHRYLADKFEDAESYRTSLSRLEDFRESHPILSADSTNNGNHKNYEKKKE